MDVGTVGAAGATAIDESTADLLGISADIDDVKEVAVIIETAASKRPKLTHNHFFEDVRGLKSVIKSCPKIRFKDKGHEFEDLKNLLAHLDGWRKDLFPSGAGEHLEDFVLKSRALLSEPEKLEDGRRSDPRERLHLLRHEYKKEGTDGIAAARKRAEEAAAAKEALRTGGDLPEDTRRRIEENRRRALEKRRLAGSKDAGAGPSGGALRTEPAAVPDEARQRIEANKQKALELKRKREEAAEAAALEEAEAAFAEAQAPATHAPTRQAPVRTANFDDEDDVFGFGMGLDDFDDFVDGPPRAPLPQQQAQQLPRPGSGPTGGQAVRSMASLDEEEDPFGLGFGLDDEEAFQLRAPDPPPAASASGSTGGKAPQASVATFLDEEEDPFGMGFDLDEP